MTSTSAARDISDMSQPAPLTAAVLELLASRICHDLISPVGAVPSYLLIFISPVSCERGSHRPRDLAQDDKKKRAAYLVLARKKTNPTAANDLHSVFASSGLNLQQHKASASSDPPLLLSWSRAGGWKSEGGLSNCSTHSVMLRCPGRRTVAIP